MAGIAREQWKRFGRTPGDLLALTPFELVALFAGGTGGAADGALDRVAELHRVNHTVRAPEGLPPVAPPWLAPEVPRGP